MQHDNLYGYKPSIAAGVIFIILFALTTAYHILQLTKAKSWYFIPFVIGGIFQIIGYICKCLGHDNLTSVTIYALQSVLILLAPPLYAASVYMVLGRLVTYLQAEKSSLVPVKWVTKLFVAGDVFSFMLQSAGGGLMAGSSSSMRTTGSNVVIGGLVVQLLFFGFFVVVAAVFHYRITKSPTIKSTNERQMTRGQGWQQRNWVTVLMALSIFRLIEYKYGFDGYLMTHEVFGYIFDALLMFVAMVVMNVYHPAVILGNGKGEILKILKRCSCLIGEGNATTVAVV
ncbi:RTA-like protein [Penicillium maclennaniae]|uniref:RTA-like protein n=1 Tax=Penicillium maclennaniae TaxID=1343394 RepID=UPI0025424829|nr:RTA-like protein [Penicillium maclennaniae]KAJ5676811.1 RTA-like protein [Penicillium maclennaniae]